MCTYSQSSAKHNTPKVQFLTDITDISIHVQAGTRGTQSSADAVSPKETSPFFIKWILIYIVSSTQLLSSSLYSQCPSPHLNKAQRVIPYNLSKAWGLQLVYSLYKHHFTEEPREAQNTETRHFQTTSCIDLTIPSLNVSLPPDHSGVFMSKTVARSMPKPTQHLSFLPML